MVNTGVEIINGHGERKKNKRWKHDIRACGPITDKRNLLKLISSSLLLNCVIAQNT